MELNQQDSEAWIFGSGFEIWSWWRSIERVDWDYDDEDRAPDGWVWRVVGKNPCADGFEAKTINHDYLMGVFGVIAGGGGGDDVSARCRRTCRAVFADPENVDFDAGSGDEVVQVAVFGKVYYG